MRVQENLHKNVTINPIFMLVFFTPGRLLGSSRDASLQGHLILTRYMES